MLSKILYQGSRLVVMPLASGPVLLPLLASALLSHAISQIVDE